MNDAKPNITVDDVIRFIRSASKDDRRWISSALSEVHNEEIAAARAEFRIGDRVKFTVRKRGWGNRTIRGTVVRKNVKTIHVRPNDGGREWKVTASLLQKDEDPPAAG